jgi:hypothetical protein
MRKRRVERTRCSGTMTEAEFRNWVLAALRRLTMRWKPANDAWKINTRPNKSGKGRHKIEHQCAMCLKWFPKYSKRSKNIGVVLDHIVPIGGLSCLSKLEQWVLRALVEVEGYQKLCTLCHQIKTNSERSLK